MISSRFAPAVCVLAALALIPAVIHSYVGALAVDGRSAQAIPGTLAGFSSLPTTRHEAWGREKFESEDWIERRYASGTGDVILTVVRSYDLKRLYHHAEIDVVRGASFVEYETARVPGRDMPIHVLRTARGEVAVYALHYDEGFVEHPIRFQMLTAGQLLLSPRRAMTLLFAWQPRVEAAGDLSALPVTRLLLAAVDAFLAQPAPGTR